MAFLLGLLSISFSIFASPHFTTVRFDQTIPEECQDMELGFYQLPPEFFFVGRQDGVKMGYTFEYPIKRGDATILWHYFQSATHGKPDQKLLNQIKSRPALFRDFKIIEKNYRNMDFDFEKEGDVLELLAIEKLYEEFPENTYFITGGFEYHYEDDPRTVGELDVFVGMRDSCQAVAVGETKLGTRKALGKAREQLKRFGDFLVDHHRPKLSGEYHPRKKAQQQAL